MNKDRELKPCPFCGSDLIDIQSSIQMEQTDIRCTDCDIRISFKCCEEDAVQDWNKRSYKPLGKEEIIEIAKKNFVWKKTIIKITKAEKRKSPIKEKFTLKPDFDILAQAIINARGG